MHGKMKILRTLTLAGLVALSACNLFEGGTHVREGQLYQPGVASYDHYFKEVHELQLAQTAWPEDKKASRRALIDYLKLSLDAADVTVAQATHERMVGAAHQVGSTRLDIKADDAKVVVANEGRVDGTTKDLFRAIETTVKAELARRKTLNEIPNRIDELTKAGRELEPHVRDDFAKNGGSLASDVKGELTSSYEVLSAISAKARTESREAEDFIAVLDRAVSSDASEPLPQALPTASGPKPPPAKPPPASTAKPTATTTPKPPPPSTGAPPPKPPPAKPPPAGGGGDEVFNP
jgi:hypothetical protein